MSYNLTNSRLGSLQDAWAARGDHDVGEWVQIFSSSYFNCDIGLVAASEFLSAQPAELQAALVLASMEDEDLELVSKFNPPITTWFFIAECPREHLLDLLEGLEATSTTSKAEKAQQIVRGFLGPTLTDAISSLDSSVFSHLAKKSEQYGALNDKHRHALKSFGARLRRGQALTPKQVAYAQGLLQQLIELGVVSRKSPDGDNAIMEKVLSALGRG